MATLFQTKLNNNMNMEQEMEQEMIDKIHAILDRIEAKLDSVDERLAMINKEIDKNKPSKTITNEYDGEIMFRKRWEKFGR